MRWWGWETLRVSSTIPCKKGLPGGTTLHAKFKVPISDCNSSRVQDFLLSEEARDAWIRSNLSRGSLASILSESRIMPMNSKTLSGPWVLLGFARGNKITECEEHARQTNPTCLAVCVCVCVGGGGGGGSRPKCGKQMKYSICSEESTRQHLITY